MLKTTCRLCDSDHLASVATLPDLPLVDAYSRAPNAEPLYPCGLQLCRGCHHIQLSEVVPADLLFRSDYLFQTADYPWLVRHYDVYAAQAFEEFKPVVVFEIGSNDGTLLKMFDRGSHMVLQGFDPSGVPASAPTRKEFFNADTRVLFGNSPQHFVLADLIIANHVFAHNDDLASIVRGVAANLSTHGVFIFEAGSGLDLLEHHYFDTVYHEHMDYHTVAPLVSFFARFGLSLFRVEHNDSKGGTIKGYVCHANARPVEPSVRLACDLEAATVNTGAFREFSEHLTQRRKRVLDQLGDAPFIGYGAAAGGIATLHHLDLAGRCKWLVDDSPRRHGMYAPHSNLVVQAPSTLYNYEVHHDMTKVVILSWRYAEQIKAKHPALDFIVP